MMKRLLSQAKSARARRGVTLIEVLVVLAIIGLVATIVAVNVLPERERAAIKKARIDVETLSGVLENYKLDLLNYPTTEQGLAALVSPPAGLENTENYKPGGYIKKAAVDPWGRPYVYKFPGEHGGAYDLYSLGPTGKEGGTGQNAVIGNWTEQK